MLKKLRALEAVSIIFLFLKILFLVVSLALWHINRCYQYCLLIYQRNQCRVWSNLVAKTVKNLPAIWEIQVWSLGQEDPLEKEMATYSSSLAWRIPWTIQSMRLERVRHNWATFIFVWSDLRTGFCEYLNNYKRKYFQRNWENAISV